MTAWTISKDLEFSASHTLTGLPDGHQCGRLHGHNYVVRVQLAAVELAPPGFVLDYGRLSIIKRFLDAELDHRHLNDVAPFDTLNPTAEHLARFLALAFRQLLDLRPGVLVTVGVSETPKTWAHWGPA